VKLKPDFVGLEATARQPRPFEGVFAFLDILLGCSTPVVKLKHPFISNRQGCDHKTHARKQLARMPFDLGDDPARLAPAFCLIGEVGIMAFHLGRWPSPSALEKVSYPSLQNLVGAKPDGIAEIIGFQIVEQLRDGEGGVSAQIFAPQTRPAVTLNDRVKDGLQLSAL